MNFTKEQIEEATRQAAERQRVLMYETKIILKRLAEPRREPKE